MLLTSDNAGYMVEFVVSNLIQDSWDAMAKWSERFNLISP